MICDSTQACDVEGISREVDNTLYTLIERDSFQDWQKPLECIKSFEALENVHESMFSSLFDKRRNRSDHNAMVTILKERKENGHQEIP